MSPENRGEIPKTEKLKIRFEGYFDGKIDEIDEEIITVESWPTNIRLGRRIKRKDQEIDWLKRLKDEMVQTRNYIINSIDNQEEQPKT